MSWKKTAKVLICFLFIGIFSPIRAQEVPSDVTPYVQLARSFMVSFHENVIIDKSGNIMSEGELVEVRTEKIPLGSGTIISRDGLILTNCHVCEIDDQFIYDWDRKSLSVASPIDLEMLVYVLKDNDPLKAPELSYLATPVCLDEKHDIAILRIVTDKEGDEIQKDYFAYASIGNPFSMKYNEDITVIGYPAKGGKTITITDGKFLGYYLDDSFFGIDGFIKTDAAMSPGSSGGAAMNKKRLIGVPTAVTLPTLAGADLGFIYPVTWAVKSLVVAKQKHGFSTPEIPMKWLESKYNKDETRDRIYVTGEIISAHSNKATSANVIIARHDLTFERVQVLNLQLQAIMICHFVRELNKSGLSIQEIAEELEIPQKEVRGILEITLSEADLSADVVSCLEGEFFYEVTQSDDDGFFILSIPKGKDVNVFIRKEGFRDVDKKITTDDGITQSLKQIKLYSY